MRTSQIVEAYMRLLEGENRIREATTQLALEATREAAAGRRFAESLIRRSFSRDSLSRAGRHVRDATHAPHTTPFSTTWPSSDFAVSSVSFGVAPNLNSPFGGLSEFIRTITEEQQDPSQEGMTMEAIENATSTRSWSSEDSDDLPRCPITLQPFSDGDIVRRLDVCGHEFSSDAIVQVLTDRPSCPLCRADARATTAEPTTEPV